MGFSLHLNTVSFVLILVSLVFLIFGCISTPTASVFKLGTTDRYDFGIFGYCKSSGSCSSATYPLKLSDLQKVSSWQFAADTRDTLAKIFIIIPIAAFFNLISLIIVALSHCLSNTLIIISLVTTFFAFALSTILCIVVILAYYPNVGWAGWILIGSAAADLIAIPFLILALKLKNDDSTNDDDEDSSLSNVARTGTVDDLTKFDDKFGYVSAPAFNGPGLPRSYNNADETSSISKDYEYKVNNNNSNPYIQPQPPHATKTYSNSSVYNSKPQVAQDFTNHQKPSAISLAQQTNASSYYEDAQVNLVNGPNTPISAKQQMAPNLVPKVATPTSNDPPPLSNPPQLPYPTSNQGSPLNRPGYNPTNYGVFEHHPEVEGHKPFTELNDDDDDVVADDFNQNNQTNRRSIDNTSDNDSDFTSVSQRAVNPKYNPNGQYYQMVQPPPVPQNSQHYNQYPNASQYSPQFAPNMQMRNVPQGGYQPSPNPQQQGYFPAPQNYQPQQQPYYNQAVVPPPQQQQQARGPTISDNVLNNNPDFALGLGGGAAKRKAYGGPARPMGPSAMPGMPGGLPNASRMGAPSQLKRVNGLRDGPYGMLR